MGRTAAGVRGIRARRPGDEVIALIIIGAGPIVDGVRERLRQAHVGRGFPVQGRGGQGVIAMQTSERNGRSSARSRWRPTDELMLITSTGTLVRTPRRGHLDVGRNTQGVRLIRLDEGERLVGIARVEPRARDDEGRRRSSRRRRD